MTERPVAHVFKAYDIRGLSPEEIDSAFARRLGRAIVKVFGPRRVLVGRDMRTTSFPLESALIEGLTSSGVDVIRIGMCSTPSFNVLIGLGNGLFDLGIMVTASHNPGKYNGFKLTRGNCLPIGQGSGMEELHDAYMKDEDVVAISNGKVSDDLGAMDRYIDHIIELADMGEMPRMRVAIDAGNGMGGVVLPKLLAKLPWIDAVPLFFEPDGTFPNHEANPLKVETLRDLTRAVKGNKCILGVAFDGDADRVGFVDELGEPVPGDILTAFLGSEMLAREPGGLILYDVRSSWSVPEAIEARGGRSEPSKVGHANIKKAMRQSGAIFGGELSMHFYFKEIWNCESGDLAMLRILKAIAREQKTFSSLWKPLQKYVHSEEINFEVADTKAAIERLSNTYRARASSFSDLDGIRIEFRNAETPANHWWFNVRASNTEPLLRLNVEAADEKSLRMHIDEISRIIHA